MPIYEYDCPKCGRFEVTQKMSDPALTKKHDCNDPKCPCSAERLISASAFHLKGGGWYKTDYKGGSTPSTPASSTSGSSGSSDSSSSSTSDSKSGDSGSSDTTKKKAGCGTKCGCH